MMYINQSKTKTADLLLLLVIALAPFFKGLYYEQEMLGFQAAVNIAFLLFLTKNRSLKNVHPMDFAAAAFAIGYLLSIPGAADVREALLAFMRILAGLMIYIIVSRRASDKVFRFSILSTIYISGIVASAGTLLNLAGLIETANVWDNGIIQTTFEYKNTGALFFLICFLIGVYLANNSVKLKNVILISCVNFVYILLLMGTQSRTVWLLSPLCLLIVIWGLPANTRFPAIVQTIITAIPALALSGQVINSLNESSPGQAVALISLGLFLTGIAVFLWLRLCKDLSKTSMVLVVVSALFLIIAAVAFAGTSATSVGEKLNNIINFDFNARERIVFFQDAFKIFARNPLLGTGGRGWDVLYLNTQSYGYYAENIHNDLLQIAVESGVVGLVPFLSLWAVFFLICFRYLRQNTDNTRKQGVWLLIGLGTAILMHSMFDFDLAHGAMAFIIWTVFGLARSYAGTEADLNKSPVRNSRPSLNFPVFVSVMVFGILYSVVSLSFLTGDILFAKGEIILKTGNLAATRDTFEKSLAFDPLKANTLLSLAQINLAIYQRSDDPAALENALMYAGKSIAVRPSEPLTRSVYSTALLIKGDFPGSVREAKAFTNLHPMLQRGYEQLAYTNLSSGIALAKKGSMDEAVLYFENTIDVINIIDKRLKAIPPYYMQMWKANQAVPVLSVSPLLKVYAGTANICLGNRTQGQEMVLKGLKEGPSLPEVQIWNTLALHLQGKENESRALLNQVSARNPGFLQMYNDIVAIWKV